MTDFATGQPSAIVQENIATRPERGGCTMSLKRYRGKNISGFPAGIVMACLAIASCDSSPANLAPLPPPPPLEAVDYSLLGSGKVLFEREWYGQQVRSGKYLIDADAGSTASVLEDRRMTRPNLSPDGTAVAYLAVTDFQSGSDVYVTDLEDGAPRRISSFSGYSESSPAWTPDASGIIYFHSFSDDSTHARIIRDAPATGVREVLRTFPHQYERLACPLPDLSPILAISSRGGLAFTCLGGLAAAALGNDPFVVHEIGVVEGLSWSPDGREIAMTVPQRADTDEISATVLQVLDVATGAIRRLAVIPHSGDHVRKLGSVHSSVCWLSANGKIVFTAPHEFPGDRSLRANVYVIGADGSGLTRLTTESNVFDWNISCAR
jgi:hypothetical protein